MCNASDGFSLFADVAPALQEWVKDGRKLYIYSSGSVEAQKLLFGHTADGDLTEVGNGHAMGYDSIHMADTVTVLYLLMSQHRLLPNIYILFQLFTDFFDTEVGAKNDADSYKCIVKKLSCNPDDVLFLTDLPKGMYSVLYCPDILSNFYSR